VYSTDKVKIGNPYEYEYSSDEEHETSKQAQILGGRKLISTVLDFLEGRGINKDTEKALLYYLVKSPKCTLNTQKSACEISKGAFGKAYKLEEDGHAIVVKVPRLKKKTESLWASALNAPIRPSWILDVPSCLNSLKKRFVLSILQLASSWRRAFQVNCLF
jgi:hypothetical protein